MYLHYIIASKTKFSSSLLSVMREVLQSGTMPPSAGCSKCFFYFFFNFTSLMIKTQLAMTFLHLFPLKINKINKLNTIQVTAITSTAFLVRDLVDAA